MGSLARALESFQGSDLAIRVEWYRLQGIFEEQLQPRNPLDELYAYPSLKVQGRASSGAAECRADVVAVQEVGMSELQGDCKGLQAVLPR